MDELFTLELLHVADQEAGVPALDDAPRFSAVLNALKAEDVGNDGVADNTIVLSSGDAIIPGLFFNASAEVFNGPGRADILIQNELGIQAIAFGNHEFDLGTALLNDLIGGGTDDPTTPDVDESFEGTEFPYLSANLDFSTDANLAGLVGPDAVAPAPNTIAASTVIEVNGAKIGVVGATTPTINNVNIRISSPGDVTVLPQPFDGIPTDEQLDALAAEIQADVDALLAANPDVNKVVLLAHMQQISIEQQLAERLSNVDIIVAGGSNTRLLDETDRLRDGDTEQGVYPIIKTDADGNPVAVVNTDGNYKYVGRLVIDFDENGVIIPESYNPEVSGAYATDAQGVADLGAEDLVDPDIQAIVDALRENIVANESNFFGLSDVYLDGLRSSVRTEETNLGNLTADANLAAAKEIDPSTVISLKNGGGIRDDIGQQIVPTGSVGDVVELPTEAVTDADGNIVKPAGGISQNDIANSLRFNNGLTLVTVTAEELAALLEHGVAESSLDPASEPGRFPQVSGVSFSFDVSQPPGDRIQSLAVTDTDGTILDTVIQNGEVVGDPSRTFRMVTLGFLADGGDGYPFPTDATANRLDFNQPEEAPRTGDATFAPDGSEQDALAEYLFDNFFETPFAEADTDPSDDTRIQNLAFRADTVLEDSADEPSNPVVSAGPFSEIGRLVLEDGAEINAFDPTSAQLFVVSGATVLQVVDLSDPTQPTLADVIDLSSFGGGINSVAVKNGVVALAVAAETSTDEGSVVFLTTGGEVMNQVAVGALPDMVTFTPDGTKVLVANEGEPNDDYSIDPEGSISIIDISNGVENAIATTADFTAFNTQKADLQAEGVKLFGPNATVAQDVEPEYIAVAPDGTTAWVTLQENNAIAIVDIASASVQDILPLGVKDFSIDAQLDASNRDGGINIRNWPVFGLYQPDSIASYEVDGTTYYLTANEGDARIRPDGDLEDADGNVILEEGVIFNEESRIGDDDVILDPAAFPNAEALKQDENLGRLKITNTLGDTDGDGDYDQLFTFGGRSFSIWDENGNLVFDSGDDIATITAELTPEFFNANDGDPEEFDERSDDKGAEPEALTIGQIGDTTYAFVGLERAGGGVLIYDITNPATAEFVQYVRSDQDIAPEGVSFVSSDDSPNGDPLLLVTNEESNTLAIYAADAEDTSDDGGDDGDNGSDGVISELLDLTGFDGELIANLTLSREAAFDNILQFYETDAQGAVGGLLPGAAGYEDAVRERLIAGLELFVENLTTTDTDVLLGGGTYYAPALLVNGDPQNLITIDDGVMGMSRIRREDNVWSFEDLTDFDYNDFVLTLNAAEAASSAA